MSFVIRNSISQITIHVQRHHHLRTRRRNHRRAPTSSSSRYHRQLDEKPTGVCIEYKEAQNGVPDSLYDTVASFLNREGGVILLGVRDDG